MSAMPLLQAQRLSVRFGNFQALDNVTFDVHAGELLALIGPNGAGKTTILNVLSGELTPTEGTVTFDGKATHGLPPHVVVKQGLARTFQAAEPFQYLTVRENVMTGAVPHQGCGLLRSLGGKLLHGALLNQLREQADVHLDKVGLLDKADMPAMLLTAGQRRLLSIARALATGAKMLVLDEPGAGLNESEKNFLGDVILSLSAEGKTILFIDHDMPLVSRIANRIMVLDRGKLIADGDPDVVRNDPRVLSAYLGPHAPAQAIAPVARDDQPSYAKPLLEVDHLSVSYGGLVAVDNVSFTIGDGELVSFVGANGAGKSSLLRALARAEKSRAERIIFDGKDVLAMATADTVAAGITLVPEGRALFGSLTVAENLAAGRYAARRAKGFGQVLWQTAKERTAHDELLETVYDLFPILKERSHQLAGTLSGGQGQMLAIGRALMGAPRLLLLDEPSVGLAPRVVEEIFESILSLRKRGMTILLVEQNSAAALSICDHGFVLANGRIVSTGTGADLLRDPKITEAYLGSSSTAAPEMPVRMYATH